jgi:hypothetical protein
MWRGGALEDVADSPFVAAQAEVLEERRLGAIESRVAADLALGRHAELVPELARLAGEHPYREGLRAQLMLALYRGGRQAEALQVYRDTRHLLSNELGIDPGAELQALEGAILRQDPTLAVPELHSPPALATVPAGDGDARATVAPAPARRRRTLAVAVVVALATIGAVGTTLWIALIAPGLQPRTPVISSVAGNGVGGFGLDGVTALASALSHPAGVAVDRNRVVYFVDGERVRRIGSNGRLATVA